MSLHVLANAACSFMMIRSQHERRSCTTLFSNGFSLSRAPFMAAAANLGVSKSAIEDVNRRSGNYQPSLWGYDFLQSLTSEFAGKSYATQVKNLKEDVRLMLDRVLDSDDALYQLELIDTMQRLGVSYHFEKEIKRFLNKIYNTRRSQYYDDHDHDRDKQKQDQRLHAVALEFRLLRQHGYEVPAESTLCSFMDENGSFKSSLREDFKGLLSLYEAAHLLIEEESSIFYETLNFTTTHLKEYVNSNGDGDDEDDGDGYLSTLVNHSLELPLHWRMPRLEARWFIDVYGKGPDSNPILLELAILDFNVVQAVHQDDLRHVSRWWKETGLGEKINFSRDRIVQNFFWTVGMIFEPQFGYCRRSMTQVNALITTIDDVYDVYGTMDELELFTDAVNRWDIAATEKLPVELKLCFQVLHKSINEMAFHALRDQGVDIIFYLRNSWANLCKAYLLEAKWFSSGYIPTLEEYMENGWVSISAPVMLIHAYAFTANPIAKETFDFLLEYPNIIRRSSMILRLVDDLGTSSDEMKKGDVPKSMECYMQERGVSEWEAREHVQDLIGKTWMKMNRDRFEKPDLFRKSKEFTGIAMNLGRMAQCVYQFGDGHGSQDLSKHHILSIIFHAIPQSQLT